MSEFLLDILSTVLGGLILALIFFWLREKIFPLPVVNGSWIFKQTTTKTEYNPYRNMELEYLALICKEGNKIFGTAEKVRERSSNGERDFCGKNRSLINIKGHIQKKIFSADEIVFHMFEQAEKRCSSTMHLLKHKKKQNIMEGQFASTIANQEGFVVWTKRS